MPVYILIPIAVLGALVLLMGLLVFLGRFRQGRYLRPLVLGLMKVPLLRRLFQKLSKAALERQNPELVSVMRKLERAGGGRDPVKAQQVIHSLNPAERRAYTEYVETMREQGSEETVPTNRQLRRLQQRQYGQPRAGGGARKRKKR
jgi:phytoene dehydrogenase-like protein